MKRLVILALGTLMCGLVSTVASAQAAPDWQAVEAEAIRTIQAYVRINTSNPPGDVTKAADFLTGLLQREGIPVTRYESSPGRATGVPPLDGVEPPPASGRCWVYWSTAGGLATAAVAGAAKTATMTATQPR